MWIVRALVSFGARLLVGVVFSLALALIQAPLRGTSFTEGFRIALYVTGAFMLLLGAAGQSESAQAIAGDRIPFMPAWTRPAQGDRSVSTTFLFFLTGAALFGIAIAMDSEQRRSKLSSQAVVSMGGQLRGGR